MLFLCGMFISFTASAILTKYRSDGTWEDWHNGRNIIEGLWPNTVVGPSLPGEAAVAGEQRFMRIAIRDPRGNVKLMWVSGDEYRMSSEDLR